MFERLKHKLKHRALSRCAGKATPFPGLTSSERWYSHLHQCDDCGAIFDVQNTDCA